MAETIYQNLKMIWLWSYLLKSTQVSNSNLVYTRKDLILQLVSPTKESSLQISINRNSNLRFFKPAPQGWRTSETQNFFIKQ